MQYKVGWPGDGFFTRIVQTIETGDVVDSAMGNFSATATTLSLILGATILEAVL